MEFLKYPLVLSYQYLTHLNSTYCKAEHNGGQAHQATDFYLLRETEYPTGNSADFSRMGEAAAEMISDYVINVLFCGHEYPTSTNYTREYLKGYPFIKVDEVAQDEVADVIHRYDICVPKHKRLDAKLISKAVNMKLIVQYGVGLEGVDIDAATESSIKVARIPGSGTGNSASCAEMAIYLMLGLLRKQKEMEAVLKQKKLGMPMGETLLGKTVFILGFGSIGVDLAKRLRVFGVKILATKRSWSSKSLQSNGTCTNAPSDEVDQLVDKKGGTESLYDFAAEADIVVTCLTLNSETAGIVDGKFLSSMKKGALLVNIARGGLLDYDSVYQQLESGHLGGLAMDVAWTEPFDPEDPILKFPNVLITPHLAGITELSYRSMAKVVGDCALRLHAGKPLAGTGIQIVN
ncbi:hypothetical protein Cni_G11708 [Canna indica]|uniref:Uncharacterized protein n=1 Tax=Canna indica TaxID=4628 RepID=A0AAQ3K6I4_9LILI|nr:hypothetical protein Cni_G11708 [Canna indica]